MSGTRDTTELDALIADPAARLHFVGLAGAGMSALAEFRVQSGGRASGSDRFFDQGSLRGERDRFARAGIEVFAQDGSGVEGAAAVVASTAVEAEIADLVRARELGVRIVHRAELLASHVRARTTIAVAGTSGKSTVVAMVFEALAGAGLDPGLITGGELCGLASKTWRGNGWAGTGPLVIEADESDGSLVRYEPEVGVVLNLHRDHAEPEQVLESFRAFGDNARQTVVSEDRELASLRPAGCVFGLGPEADLRAEQLDESTEGSTFAVDGTMVSVPIPGRHNALNALAALAACRMIDVPPAAAAPGLSGFRGVSRRFEILGRPRGVEVIDDYAHNPAKVAAALAAARARSRRTLAIFQPHGFGPTRRLRDDFVAAFAGGLRADDRLFLLDIFYAGGTVTKDIASEDLAADLRARGTSARAAGDRHRLAGEIADLAREGDSVILMGARDPSLGSYARELLRSVRTSPR